jgi:phage shock protein E
MTIRSSVLAAGIAVVALLVAACGSTPAAAGGAAGPATPGATAAVSGGGMVDGSKAKKLVAGGAKLVDVRSADEYGAKHIEGAENAPVETIGESDLGPKDTALVLYCRSGARAARAATTLRSKGYKNVYELGAMSNWDK